MSELEAFELTYGCKRPHPAIDGGAFREAWDEAWELWKVAYAKGAEDMRERAARLCGFESVTLATRDQTRGALYMEAKIRALPITPTNTEGEQG
jgi:hypothetical protein